MVIAEGDKTLGTAVDDATIKLNISRKFLMSENNLFIKSMKRPTLQSDLLGRTHTILNH